MRRRGNPAAFIVLAGLFAACGSAEPSDPSLVVQLKSQALLQDASVLVVYFYEGTLRCGDIEAQSPRPQAIMAVTESLDDDKRARGIKFQLDTIAIGTYVVFADALSAGGQSVGTGCLPDQVVQEKEVTSLSIVISG